MRKDLILRNCDIEYNQQVEKLADKKEGVVCMAKNITFQVTDDCCLRCTYCYQHNKGHHKMTFDIAKQAIDQILEADEKVKDYIDSYHTEGVVLDFIGGECLMEIDLMDKIVDYFVSRMIELNHPWLYRFRIHVGSNGQLYFEPKVQEFFRKYLPMVSYSVTIDGNKELHDKCRLTPEGNGSYDKAVAAAQHYHDVYGGYVGSKITISPYNLDYVSEAIIGFIENGNRAIYANCVFEEGWEIQHAQQYYWELKKIADYILDHKLYYDLFFSRFDPSLLDRKSDEEYAAQPNVCGGTGNMLAIDYAGNYYPCIRYMPDALRPDRPSFAIGNIYEGIGQTDCTKCKLEELDGITVASQSEEKCLKCKYHEGCVWCSGYNYDYWGTPNKRTIFICDVHKTEVLVRHYFFNKLNELEGDPERFPILVEKEECLKIIPEEEYNMLLELSGGQE